MSENEGAPKPAAEDPDGVSGGTAGEAAPQGEQTPRADRPPSDDQSAIDVDLAHDRAS